MTRLARECQWQRPHRPCIGGRAGDVDNRPPGRDQVRPVVVEVQGEADGSQERDGDDAVGAALETLERKLVRLAGAIAVGVPKEHDRRASERRASSVAVRHTLMLALT